MTKEIVANRPFGESFSSQMKLKAATLTRRVFSKSGALHDASGLHLAHGSALQPAMPPHRDVLTLTAS